MKLAVSKALGRICVVVLLCLVVALSATACKQNSPDDSKTNDSLNSETGNSSITSNDQENTTEATDSFFESMENMKLPTILSCYAKTEFAVFLKLEISKIYDEMYIYKSNIPMQDPAGYMMVECTIAEDLYERGFERGQKIVVPVLLKEVPQENNPRVLRNLDVSEVKEWLSGMDYIYVKTNSYYEKTQSYKKEAFVVENNHATELQTAQMPCVMSFYELLPSVDGKVSPKQLDDFLYKRNITKIEIYGMNEFCYDGIPCAEFEDNVRELSKYFDNKRNQ